MVGGSGTGLDEFLSRGGDGKDTISGAALASGKTGIAEANNKPTTAATLDGGEGFAASSAGHDVIAGSDGKNLLARHALAPTPQAGNHTTPNQHTLAAGRTGASTRTATTPAADPPARATP